MFHLLALFYIMIQCIFILYNNSTPPWDIPENVRQPYPGNGSLFYGARIANAHVGRLKGGQGTNRKYEEESWGIFATGQMK